MVIGRRCKRHTDSRQDHDQTWASGAVRQGLYQLSHCAASMISHCLRGVGSQINHWVMHQRAVMAWKTRINWHNHALEILMLTKDWLYLQNPGLEMLPGREPRLQTQSFTVEILLLLWTQLFSLGMILALWARPASRSKNTWTVLLRCIAGPFR